MKSESDTLKITWLSILLLCLGGSLGGALGKLLGIQFITRIVFPKAEVEGTWMACLFGLAAGLPTGLLAWGFSKSKAVASVAAFVAGVTFVLVLLYWIREGASV